MLYVFGLEFHVDCEFGVHSLFRCEVIKLTSRNFRLGMRILYEYVVCLFQFIFVYNKNLPVRHLGTKCRTALMLQPVPPLLRVSVAVAMATAVVTYMILFFVRMFQMRDDAFNIPYSICQFSGALFYFRVCYMLLG